MIRFSKNGYSVKCPKCGHFNDVVKLKENNNECRICNNIIEPTISDLDIERHLRMISDKERTTSNKLRKQIFPIMYDDKKMFENFNKIARDSLINKENEKSLACIRFALMFLIKIMLTKISSAYDNEKKYLIKDVSFYQNLEKLVSIKIWEEKDIIKYYELISMFLRNYTVDLFSSIGDELAKTAEKLYDGILSLMKFYFSDQTYQIYLNLKDYQTDYFVNMFNLDFTTADFSEIIKKLLANRDYYGVRLKIRVLIENYFRLKTGYEIGDYRYFDSRMISENMIKELKENKYWNTDYNNLNNEGKMFMLNKLYNLGLDEESIKMISKVYTYGHEGIHWSPYAKDPNISAIDNNKTIDYDVEEMEKLIYNDNKEKIFNKKELAKSMLPVFERMCNVLGKSFVNEKGENTKEGDILKKLKEIIEL